MSDTTENIHILTPEQDARFSDAMIEGMKGSGDWVAPSDEAMKSIIKELRERIAKQDEHIAILVDAIKDRSVTNDPQMKWITTGYAQSGCLHDSCPTCHGTGQGPTGPCVHMLSCPCPKCSPTY